MANCSIQRSLVLRFLTLPILAFALLTACAPSPEEFTPSEALGAFLTAVDRSTHAPDQRKVAYGWLDLESQEKLKERARLTNSLAGRKIQPWEMLVPGRVSFAGQSMAGVRMTSKIEGDKATVSILIDKGKPIEVPMLHQTGQWRVVLGLGSEANEPAEAPETP